MTSEPGRRALGKVILLGEHAVVHGHTALAAALDRGIHCLFDGRPRGAIKLSVPHWDLEVTAGDDHPVGRALTVLAEKTGADHLSLVLDAVAEIPARVGLGSSAALSVAVTRTLALAAGREFSDAQVRSIADAGERCFHRDPSGVDVALATSGGAGTFRRDRGFVPLSLPPLRLVVGLSGETRDTGAMVDRVAAALADDARATGARLARLGALAEHGAQRWEQCELAELGAAMQEAQTILRELGLSTRRIDTMVDSALARGAAGAKLTGAGGGGAVIALAPGREDDVRATWHEQGREVFVCAVGGQP